MYSVAICGFNGFSQIISRSSNESKETTHGLSDPPTETVPIPVVINITDDANKSYTFNNVKDIVMSWSRVHVVMQDDTVVTTDTLLDTAQNVKKHAGIRHVCCNWKNTFWITADDRCHVCEQGREFEQQDTGYMFDQQDTDSILKQQGPSVKLEQEFAASNENDTSSMFATQHDTVSKLELNGDNSEFTNDDKRIKNICSIQVNDSTNIVLTTSGKMFHFELNNTCHIFRELVTPDCLQVRSVSCGKHHTVLVTNIGSVYSFGTGSHGELGHGTIDNEPKPRRIEILDGVTVTAISAGGWHSVALGSCGELYVWGWNERGQLGMPCSHVRNNPCNLNDNSDDREVINIQTLPQLLDIYMRSAEQSGKKANDNLVTVIKVACGTRHTVVVTEDGYAFTWGWNEYGQLGLGDAIDRDRPCVLDHFVHKLQRVVDVFAGHWNSAFILRNDS